MGTYYSHRVVTDGLVLYLDAANPRSYPGSGDTWYDLSGNGKDFTNDPTFNHSTNNSGSFLLLETVGTKITTSVTTSQVSTVVMWIKTTDLQSLFLSGNIADLGQYYLGAYRIGNKEYYSLCGSPQFFIDTADTPNIFDYFPDGNWHMVEFKNVNFSSWPQFKFNKYSLFEFGNGELAVIKIYDRLLTADESLKNFNALRGRYGI